MDVWGPARIHGQGHKRYFLLVVDDYSRYTTVFPLRSKGEVPEVLIDWIRGTRRQLSERFGLDLPVLRPHSDRGGEFSSDLLRAFCRVEGIRQTFTLPASPQQNGTAERRIGMVMDVARTSMIHAAAPHFLWPFATTPTLRWTGKVGDPSAFRVWGSRAFVCDTSAARYLPVPFPGSSLASPLMHPGGSSTTPPRVVFCPLRTSRLTSRCLTTVSFPTALPFSPPPPLFLAPGTPPVDPLPPQGPAPSDVSQVDPAEPIEVAVDSGAARGAEPAGAGTGGAEPGGAEPERVESGGSEPERVESGGAYPERVEPGGAEPGGTGSGGAEPTRAESGGSPGVPLWREPLSLQRLREWYAWCCRRATGAAGGAAGGGATGGAAGAGAAGGAAGARAARAAGGAAGAAGGAAGAAGGAAGAGAAGCAAGATGGAAGAGAVGDPAGVGAAGAAGRGDARTTGTGAVGARGATSVGAAGAGPGGAAEVVAGDPGAEGTGAISVVSGVHRMSSHSRSYSRPLLPCPSPYSRPTRGLMECHEPESRPVLLESRPASPVRTVRAGRVSRPRPPPVPGTHSMTLRPSTAPQRVPLPSPPASSLPDGLDPGSDSLCAARPAVTRFLATAVTDPLFESIAVSALVVELVDFAIASRLDYATLLVVESASTSVCPPSVSGECALGTDVLEDRHEEFECFAATVPHLVSMLLAPEGDPDARDIPTPRSYAESIEGP
ncbi:unnamed protein product [Closterium sp. NIES-54]